MLSARIKPFWSKVGRTCLLFGLMTSFNLEPFLFCRPPCFMNVFFIYYFDASFGEIERSFPFVHNNPVKYRYFV